MNTINAEEILIPLIKCRCISFSRIFPAQTQSPIQTRSHLATKTKWKGDRARKKTEGYNMLHAGGYGMSNGVAIIVNVEISKEVERVER